MGNRQMAIRHNRKPQPPDVPGEPPSLYRLAGRLSEGGLRAMPRLWRIDGDHPDREATLR